MKKAFDLYDALFILALIFKLRGLEPVPTWFEVFLPYVFQFGIMLIIFFSRIYGITGGIEGWLTRKAIAWRVSMEARRAKKFINKKFKQGQATGNPGRVKDTVKEPNA